MSQEKAMLRDFVERVEGVARTHYELEIEGSSHKRTLVVEVDFDLDPSSPHYSRTKINAVEDAYSTILREGNGDMISKLKIVGHRSPASGGKIADAAAGHGVPSKSGTTTARGQASSN